MLQCSLYKKFGVKVLGSLKVQGLAKSFGIEVLFRDVQFEVAKGDKVGFVGANGAGKTTLMRALLGQEEYDAGMIQFDSADTIGYVEQQAQLMEGTLYDTFKSAFSDIIELAARKKAMEKEIAQGADEEKLALYGRMVERFEQLEGYDYESRIRRVAFGLGFTEEDFSRPVAYLSGGQRTSICLA